MIALLNKISFFAFILLTRMAFSAVGNPEGSIPPGPLCQVLVPTGKKTGGYPVLKPLPVSDNRYIRSGYLFENTYLSETVILYRYLQDYLVREGDKKGIEPAYLLLSGVQGGFPRRGFYLLEGGRLLDKRETWYVDLPGLEKDVSTLGSVTQIFPHEMGHIFFRLLAPLPQEKYDALSSDIHYFSICTNYLTAFNEGFAEHFENAARLFEKNDSISKRIENDARRLDKESVSRVRGFERDFRWPLRMGYYRAGMLLWYQRYENLKRYRWALDSSAFYTNRSLEFGRGERNILYRNAGSGFDHDHTRNASQTASNEGVINAFFTRLLKESVKVNSLQEHYLKLFAVMKGMDHPAGDTSFLQLFILAWERTFPQDKDFIENIYRRTAGIPFDPSPVPEIWLYNDSFRHSFLVMDQFGGATVPYHSMNLNTAEITDLLGFPGMTRREALALIRVRDSIAGFLSIAGLRQVKELSAGTFCMLVRAHEKTLAPGTGDDYSLSVRNIITVNGGHILLMALAWFTVFWVIFFLFFMRKGKTLKQVIRLSFVKLLKFFLLALAGLAFFVFFPSPAIPFLGMIILMTMIDWLRSRKEYNRMPERLFTTLFMGTAILYSLA